MAALYIRTNWSLHRKKPITKTSSVLQNSYLLLLFNGGFRSSKISVCSKNMRHLYSILQNSSWVTEFCQLVCFDSVIINSITFYNFSWVNCVGTFQNSSKLPIFWAYVFACYSKMGFIANFMPLEIALWNNARIVTRQIKRKKVWHINCTKAVWT